MANIDDDGEERGMEESRNDILERMFLFTWLDFEGSISYT